MSVLSAILAGWKGRNDFLKAQAFVAGILVLAYVGNTWPRSYDRNLNKDPTMFWLANLGLFLAAMASWKHDPSSSSRGVQLLSRAQTEEWKGWMQWAFIMYHYYRASFVYNEIRVFVSAYVWMTGFGNFLYFTKKQDFSIDRALSMWLRINYFPLLLVLIVGTKLDDFYIVPLHTTGFFITMATCYAAKLLEPLCKERKNAVAILLCVLVHIIFYETPLVDTLKLFSDEIHFRFQADKYSAVIGIVCGFFWANFKQALQFYNTDTVNTNQRIASACQIALGCLFIIFWYTQFGHIQDKYIYNPFHPYIFWIPVAGWLLIRNSSKYLMECHSTVLEFFGRITLETYVLQFHLLMCHHVRHIPVVIPGSDADGTWFMKLLNMLFCGVIFVTTAYWARQHTVTTQTTITDLMGLVKSYILEGKIPTAPDLDEGVKELDPEQGKPEEETVPLNPETPTEAQHRHKFASNEV